jgi:ABC-2 type transport system ATP-binding protein
MSWRCQTRRSPLPPSRALVGAGADIRSIADSRHSLEDVYLQLIDEDVEAKRR